MHFDDLLKILGEFGKYQKIRLVLLSLVSMVCAFHAMNMVFVGASPKKTCMVPMFNITLGTFINVTGEGWRHFMTDNVNQNHLQKNCYIYDNEQVARYIHNESLTLDELKRNVAEGKISIPVVKCSDWNFATDVYGPTIVTEVRKEGCQASKCSLEKHVHSVKELLY